MKIRGVIFAGLLAATSAPVTAGITVYEKGEKKIEIGGRIQLQYLAVDPDCAPGVDCLEDDKGNTFDSRVDTLFFRRLRPYIAGTITENWLGKIEFDVGQQLQVKDAYFVFSGFKNKKSRLYIGATKAVFGREFLNSSSSLQLVERGFVGDHNFGVPDRMLGLRFDSQVAGGKLSYQLNAGNEAHDPAVNRMDFESPVNNEDDWNEGWMAAARIDWHPLGYMKFSQADFTRSKSKFTIGLSAFAWENDDDNNAYTDPDGTTNSTSKVDLESAQGAEISAAYRGHGLSFDAEYQIVNGETVDPMFTGGLYLNGETDLDKLRVVAGYMVVKDFFEIVLGWDSQDATFYAKNWTEKNVGLNFYFAEKKHNLKLQLTYSMVNNFIGIADQDQNVLQVQTQFQF